MFFFSVAHFSCCFRCFDASWVIGGEKMENYRSILYETSLLLFVCVKFLFLLVRVRQFVSKAAAPCEILPCHSRVLAPPVSLREAFTIVWRLF